MKATNNNRRAGNNIILATKDGQTSYYNWYADGLIPEKENASGYDTKGDAKYVIEQLVTEIPGYTWTTVLDKPGV